MNTLYLHQWMNCLCQCLRPISSTVHFSTSLHLLKVLAATIIPCHSNIKVSLPTGPLSSVYKVTRSSSTLKSTHTPPTFRLHVPSSSYLSVFSSPLYQTLELSTLMFSNSVPPTLYLSHSRQTFMPTTLLKPLPQVSQLPC